MLYNLKNRSIKNIRIADKKGGKMRLAIILLSVFFIYMGGTALYGLTPDDMVNIMNRNASLGEFIIWKSMIFDRGLMCLGFAITWLVVIPWSAKKHRQEQ